MNAIDNYEIITFYKVHDDKGTFEDLFEEQTEILKYYGLDWDSEVEVHFFESEWSKDEVYWDRITDAIDALAIKDGVDMVRFEKGTIGFVAYYNDFKEAFEFVPQGDKIL